MYHRNRGSDGGVAVAGEVKPASRWTRNPLRFTETELPLPLLLVAKLVVTVLLLRLTWRNVPGACQVLLDTFRQVLTKFSDFLHVTGAGLLIQTSLGSWGGLGALRTKRSG